MHFLATVGAEAERVLLVEPAAIQGEKGPAGQHVGLKRGILWHTTSGSLSAVPVSIDAKPNGGVKIARRGPVWTAELCFSDFPRTRSTRSCRD